VQILWEHGPMTKETLADKLQDVKGIREEEGKQVFNMRPNSHPPSRKCFVLTLRPS
jgi:hypothetical protein